MASAANENPGRQLAGAAYKTRFTAALSSAEPALIGPDAGDRPEAAGGLMSRRAAIGGVSMGAAALLCFALAAGLPATGAAVSDETAQKVAALRTQIHRAAVKAEALPEPKDAARGLVTAQIAADQIATLQNDYRHLTPQVAVAGGKLDAEATTPTRRNLAPYFAPSVNPPALDPWYLLASDKDAPRGVGIPMSFESGVIWVAQRSYTISDDSTVRVTWLAVESRPAAGQTAAVFAWTRADYDLTRKTFSKVQTGTTATGETLRLKVRPS
jgi:hypothetical protein